jgi:hypothetical protein
MSLLLSASFTTIACQQQPQQSSSGNATPPEYASPASTQSPPSPKPVPELDQLSLFIGTWRCFVNPTDQSPEIELTWNVQPDLNNFWYTATAFVKQRESNSNPLKVQQEVLGYDSAAKKLLRYFVTNQGNLVNLGSSGWEAEKLIWEGTVITKGQKIPLREQITRKTATEFAATWAISKTKGKWTPVSEETCKKLG